MFKGKRQQFTVGQRVRVVKCVSGPDPNHEGHVGTIVGIDQGGWDVHDLDNGESCFAVEIAPVPKDLDHLEVGDVIDCGNGDKRTVLAVLDNLIALSFTFDQEKLGGWWGKKEIKSHSDWKVKQADTSETVMTIKEIEEKLGVRNLKVKKEE